MLPEYDRFLLDREIEIATGSGLLGDYSETKAAAAATTAQGLRGDVRRTAQLLGQRLIDSGSLLTFVLLTDAFGWVARELGSALDARCDLWLAIKELPKADDLIIVETMSRTPRIHTIDSYPIADLFKPDS